ncbi:MAG: hypothetical protein KF785_04420 [Gemmatimonadales bacterium]|nr:hypothetical protein [Gemmatimonadales bacterium]
MRLHRSAGELAGLDALDPGRRRRVRRHLEGCQQCRDELLHVRKLRMVVTEVTACELPMAGFAAIRARRDAGERVILPVEPFPRPARSWRLRPILLAGSVLLVAALAAQVVLREGRSADGGEPSPSAVQREPPPVGVAVVPASGLAEVRLTAGGPFRLDVSITDGVELAVRGRGAAAQARFRVAGDGVSVTDLAGGVVEVGVPKGMVGRISLGGVTVIVSDGARLRAEATGTTGSRLVLELGR